MATNTDRALALIDAGKTVRQAAREVDISESAVHAAVKRRRAKELEAKGVCPSCGRTVRDLRDLESLVEHVLQQLDYTAATSESAEKRNICASIARALRGQ